MRSPQKTRLKFNTQTYSIYAATWLALFKSTRKKYPEYGFTTSRMRTLCAVDALVDLYKGVNTSMGVTSTQLFRLTGLPHQWIRTYMPKFVASGLITEEPECGPKRTIRRYKLTKKGQAIVDEMSGDMDIVHERIIDILYGRRLLKH